MRGVFAKLHGNRQDCEKFIWFRVEVLSSENNWRCE